MKNSLYQTSAALIICLLVYAFFTTQIPFNEDEFVTYGPILHSSMPLKFFNKVTLPIRAYDYIGISSSLIYWPIYKLWPSPYSIRLMGLLVLMLQAILISRIFLFNFSTVFICLLFFMPYAFVHFVDTGPIIINTTSIFLIYYLLKQWLDNKTPWKEFYYPAIIGITIFISIENRLSYLMLLPGIMTIAAFFIYHKNKPLKTKLEHSNLFIQVLVLGLSILIPSFILLTATDLSTNEKNVKYYEIFFPKSIIRYYSVNSYALNDISTPVNVTINGLELGQYLTKYGFAQALTTQLYAADFSQISLTTKTQQQINALQQETNINEYLLRKTNRAILKEIYPHIFSSYLTPFTPTYKKHWTAIKRLFYSPLNSTHRIYQPPKIFFTSYNLLYLFVFLLVFFYSILNMSYLKPLFWTILTATILSFFLLVITPQVWAIQHVILFFPFLILLICQIFSTATPVKYRQLLGCLIILHILTGLTLYAQLLNLKPWEQNIPTDFKMVSFLNRLSTTHNIYILNCGLAVPIRFLGIPSLPIKARYRYTPLSTSELITISQYIEKLHQHKEKFALVGYNIAINKINNGLLNLHELQPIFPTGAWKIYLEE